MIYAIKPEHYPEPEQRLEELTYKDENDFEWRISRINNGFIVKYFGDSYFKEKFFCCQLKSDQIVRVNNTNCIFFQDASFETFCIVRDILKNGFTDDIWECFEEFFTERFEHDKGMIESEFYPPKTPVTKD
jgi:hypothetical protein